MNHWTLEDFEKAIENHDQALRERPDNAELLETYQLLLLEYSRMKARLGQCSN